MFIIFLEKNVVVSFSSKVSKGKYIKIFLCKKKRTKDQLLMEEVIFRLVFTGLTRCVANKTTRHLLLLAVSDDLLLFRRILLSRESRKRKPLVCKAGNILSVLTLSDLC